MLTFVAFLVLDIVDYIILRNSCMKIISHIEKMKIERISKNIARRNIRDNEETESKEEMDSGRGTGFKN